MDRGAWRTAHGVTKESDTTEHTRFWTEVFLQGSLRPLSSRVDTCLCGDSTGQASWSALQETEGGLLEAGFATTSPREIHDRCPYQRHRAAHDLKSPSTPCLSLFSTLFPKVTWARGIFKGMLLNMSVSLVAQNVKRLPAMQEIPGSGRVPGEGNGNPLQYSCLENPMDGRAW